MYKFNDFWDNEQWICSNSGQTMFDVVAWAEKLEPYKGENE